MRGKILTILGSSILILITAGFYIVNNEFKVLSHNSLFFHYTASTKLLHSLNYEENLFPCLV